MADIVIRGLDMPRPIAGEAGYVDFRIFSDGTAVMASAKPPYYKQFEVFVLPEGHGRLIDADALIVELHKYFEDCGGRTTLEMLIKHAPPIVPAEGGTE